MKITLPQELKPLIDALITEDIKPVLVGGYLRDKFFGNCTSKDIDIELYNVSSIQQIITILKPFANPYEVGKSFGVIKLNYKSYEIDFSLPRTESKTGVGHRGFDVITHKDISFKQASIRRDFTINAMGYDLLNNLLLDPYNAQEDIKNKILTYVNKKSFIEDPLRLFRAIGFAARFKLTCKRELIELCKEIYKNGSLNYLAKERIFEELKKLLLRSQKPSIGFKLLQTMDSLKFFPELFSLSEDNYKSTLNMLDRLVTCKIEDEKLKLQLMFAVLVLSFESEDNVISFIRSLNSDKKFLEKVLSLYKAFKQLSNFIVNDYNVLTLALHVRIDELYILSSISEDIHTQNTGKNILNQSKLLHVSSCPPTRLIEGRNLIELGYKPSVRFKELLDKAFEAQLRGKFTTLEEAKRWLTSTFKA